MTAELEHFGFGFGGDTKVQVERFGKIMKVDWPASIGCAARGLMVDCLPWVFL